MKKRNRLFFIKSAVIYLFCALIMSCGYAFAPQGEYIDKSIQKIYVEAFENKTAQASIENYVRTAFINQVLLGSRFKTVSSVEEADAIIKGKIININTSPLSYRENKLVAEERTSVVLEITFYEKESGKTIWHSKGISGGVDYKMVNDINMFPVARRDALVKLSNDLAEKAFNFMMAGF